MKPALQAQLTALLFASAEALPRKNVQAFFKLSEDQLTNLCAQTQKALQPLGLQLSYSTQKIQLVTLSSLAARLQEFFGNQKVTLSEANLEVLAIVAHEQPISRDQIDEIRGVSSEQTLKNLLNKDLIAKQVSKKGSLSLTSYATTTTFLTTMGLRTLQELKKADAPTNQ